MFGAGSIYEKFQVYWAVGAILPIIFYVLTRLRPRSSLRLLNAPIMLGAMSWLPPATPLSFFTWAFCGIGFNHFIRKRFSGWWYNYNYLTAAALDSGLVIGTIVIFFAITLPNVTIPQWWGNVGVFETVDATYTAVRKTVADGETFGPSTW